LSAVNLKALLANDQQHCTWWTERIILRACCGTIKGFKDPVPGSPTGYRKKPGRTRSSLVPPDFTSAGRTRLRTNRLGIDKRIGTILNAKKPAIHGFAGFSVFFKNGSNHSGGITCQKSLFVKPGIPNI
jgi:hypothetical protein